MKHNTENLIPLNKRTKEDALRIQIAGGKSTSPAKVFNSRLNGLLQSKKLTDEQKYMLILLKDKAFTELIIELLSMDVEEGLHHPQRRDKVIDQLTKFLPTKNINLDLNVTNNSRIKELKQFLEGEEQK